MEREFYSLSNGTIFINICLQIAKILTFYGHVTWPVHSKGLLDQTRGDVGPIFFFLKFAIKFRTNLWEPIFDLSLYV